MSTPKPCNFGSNCQQITAQNYVEVRTRGLHFITLTPLAVEDA
jgi:hypothetical protein